MNGEHKDFESDGGEILKVMVGRCDLKSSSAARTRTGRGRVSDYV